MKILIAMLVTPSTDKKLLSEAIKSILPFKPLVEIHLYKGAKAMWEVPQRRAEITLQIKDTFVTHLMFMDPDDLLEPAGFALALDEMSDEGIYLKEKEFGGLSARTKYCCRLILRMDLARELALNHRALGDSDRLSAEQAYRKYKLPKSSQVAYLWRHHHETGRE